jgi:hypothetical protein
MSTDLLVKQLVDDVVRRPNTIAVISSDHGEEFFEHGNTRHGKTLYGEACQVPLAIFLPEGVRSTDSGTVISTPVSLVDVAPSVLSYLGLEVPDTMEGRRDLLTWDGAGRGNRTVYSTLNLKKRFLAAAIKDGRKVIFTSNEKGEKIEYYDLVADPGETNPLPLDAAAEEIKKDLLAWTEKKISPAILTEIEAAPLSDRADLRALGYM